MVVPLRRTLLNLAKIAAPCPRPPCCQVWERATPVAATNDCEIVQAMRSAELPESMFSAPPFAEDPVENAVEFVMTHALRSA